MIYSKKRFDAALFDLDGVVVDTEGQYTVFWTRIGEEYFPGQPDFAAGIKGSTLSQIFSNFFGGKPEWQAEVHERLLRFESEMDYPYIEGVVDFLRSLALAGVKTAVVTSSNREKMECLYVVHPELRSLFTRVFTSEDCGRSKPAPDCYLNAARQLGVPIERCMVFEDSLAGLAAARGSGAFVVGLATTLPKETVRERSDECVSSFAGISVEG